MNEIDIEQATNLLKILSTEKRLGEQETKEFYLNYLKFLMNLNKIDLRDVDVQIKYLKNLNNGYFSYQVDAYLDTIINKNDYKPQYIICLNKNLTRIQKEEDIFDFFYGLMCLGHEVYHIIENIFYYKLQISKDIAQTKLKNVEKNLLTKSTNNKEKTKIKNYIKSHVSVLNSYSTFELDADKYGIAYRNYFFNLINDYARNEELSKFIEKYLIAVNDYEKQNFQAIYRDAKQDLRRTKSMIKKYNIHPNNLQIPKK